MVASCVDACGRRCGRMTLRSKCGVVRSVTRPMRLGQPAVRQPDAGGEGPAPRLERGSVACGAGPASPNEERLALNQHLPSGAGYFAAQICASRAKPWRRKKSPSVMANGLECAVLGYASSQPGRPIRGRSARPGCPHTVDLSLVWPVGWGLLVEPLPAGLAVLFTAHNRIDRPVSGQERVIRPASSSRARTVTIVPPRRTDSE